MTRVTPYLSHVVAELGCSTEEGATARVASRTVVRATAGAREELGGYDEKEHVVVLAFREKMEERIVEEIVDTLAPRVLEESIEAVRHLPGEQVQNYTAGQTVDSGISHVEEEVIGDVKSVPQEKVRCLDKTVDVSIVRQVRVPTVQAVQKIVGIT